MSEVFTAADEAELYDLLCPWDPAAWPADRFYDGLVMAAGSVLDAGCGTGAMLHRARAQGHAGRLAGIDPDAARLGRARRRGDIEWVLGTAAQAPWQSAFDLATMTGHAFQCLATDAEVRDSLAAIRAALRPGGRLAFETRHPQARAWETWTPADVAEVTSAAGRSLRVWNDVESVTDDLVTCTETTALADGTVLNAGRETLRFLDPARLRGFLAGASLEIEAQYGDWQLGPLTPASREIITIARRT